MLSKVSHFFFTQLLLASLFSITVSAQNSTSIHGTILDDETGEPLPNANVIVMGTTIGDEADSSGRYQLQRLIKGTYFIKATRIGYKPKVVKNVKLRTGENKRVDIHLESTTLKMKEVAVEAERLWDKHLTEASLVNVKRMRSRDIISIPGTIDDPTRAVQIFSGVTGGGDYSGYLAVRGGSPDQNQVIMDGIVVPNPYRFRLAFGGGLSSINPNTTRDMYLHLGGFSAEYGNSLSSILEVESRLGNRDRIRAQGTFNFTDINGVIDGPLPYGMGSFLVSVRRTYYDFIANGISESNSAFPFYFEITNKLTFDLSKSNRLILSFTRNREGTELLNEFSDELNLTEDATSYIGSLAWQKYYGEKWRFNTVFSYYSDDIKYRAFTIDTLDQEIDYEALDSRVINYAFKTNIRYKTADESWLNWGFTATRIPSDVNFEAADLSFLYARVESPRDINFDDTYNYYATYLESSTKATEKLHLRIGARYDHSSLIDEGELSPRFSIWYQFNDRTSIEGSWGLFYQYPDPTAVYTRNIPVDLSKNLDIISAEKSTHQILAIQHDFSLTLSAKLQLYNKDIERLLLPINEETFVPMNNGRGYSRGFEFIFEKKPTKKARFSGILSYAFGNAKFRAIDSDEWLPFKYDRRHALSILGNVRLFGNWNLSILGQFSTGYPFTDVLGLRNNLNFLGDTSFEFERGARFQTRFPAFKKIDARLSYQHRVGGKAFSFYVDVINITNERNVYEITWEKRYLPDDRQQATKRVIYMLPIIPSLGVSVRL